MNKQFPYGRKNLPNIIERFGLPLLAFFTPILLSEILPEPFKYFSPLAVIPILLYYPYKLINLSVDPLKHYSGGYIFTSDPKYIKIYEVEPLIEAGLIKNCSNSANPKGIPRTIRELPEEFVIKNNVYRLTFEPYGVATNTLNSRRDFWRSSSDWKLIGKVGKVSPRETVQIHEIKPALFEKWYYICVNDGINSGLTLDNFLYQIGIDFSIFEENYMDNPQIQEAIDCLKSLGAIIESINTEFNFHLNAVYFDNRESAEAVKEWLESRIIVRKMLEGYE